MPEIRVVDEFGEVVATDTFETGETFADAAMERWPQGWPGKTVLIYDRTGAILDTEHAVNTPAREGDIYTITLTPQGPGALLGVAYGYWVLAAVSLAASYLLAPKAPSTAGGGTYEWNETSPQFLSGQSNQMRPGSRVPDVFGEMRVWPDLITTPYTIYSGQSQSLRELYVVSNGHCTINQPRLHSEAIDDLPESQITVYNPGEAWPIDFPIIRTNGYVGGIELPAPNETINYGVAFTLTGSKITTDVDGYWDDFIASGFKWFKFSSGVSAANRNVLQRAVGSSNNGRDLDVAYAWPVTETTDTVGSATFNPITYILTTTGATDDGDPATINFDGDSTIYQKRISVPDEGYTYENDGSVSDQTYTNFPDGTYDFILNNVTTTRLKETHTAYYNEVLTTFRDRIHNTQGNDALPAAGNYYVVKIGNGQSYNPEVAGTGYATSIFTVPGTVTEILSDFEFPQGMYSQEAGETPRSRSIKASMFYRLVGQDPEAAWTQVQWTFSAKTRTPRRYTRILEVPSGEYEVFYQRDTNFQTDTASKIYVDAAQLIGLHGRQDVTDLSDDVLNVTLVEISLSTQNVQQIAQKRNFNVVATRWLPDYLNDPATLVQSDYIRDAILYTLIVEAGYDIANIDVAGLGAIHDDLVGIVDQAAEFNGIIDQIMTAEDQLQIIAAVGRIIPYRRASTVYFNRLKAGLTPRTLFNGRNKLQPETRTMSFSELNDPDVVIGRFMDASNDWAESSVQWPEDVTPVNPEEQSLLGVTDASQARRMVQHSYDRRKHERDTVQVAVTDEGAMLAPGDVIAVTDHLMVEQPIQGEVVEIVADSFVFDQPIPAGDYVARLRDKFGEIYGESLVTLTAVDGTPALAVPEWAGAVMPNDPAQVGLLYSFTPDTADGSDLFYVVSVAPSRDGPVSIDGMRYSDETYASDVNTSAVTQTAKKRWRF